MATPTDTTFGTDFDAAVFRSAIKSTMQMAMPSDPTEAVTFIWDVDNTFAVPDPAGDPMTGQQLLQLRWLCLKCRFL